MCPAVARPAVAVGSQVHVPALGDVATAVVTALRTAAGDAVDAGVVARGVSLAWSADAPEMRDKAAAAPQKVRSEGNVRSAPVGRHGLTRGNYMYSRRCACRCRRCRQPP